jgi:hypothetical protein
MPAGRGEEGAGEVEREERQACGRDGKAQTEMIVQLCCRKRWPGSFYSAQEHMQLRVLPHPVGPL